MNRDLSIRAYSRLIRLSVQRGEERLYLVWTVAKESQAQRRIPGTSHREGILYETLVKSLSETLGWQRSSVRKALSAGQGSYWDIASGGKRLVYLPSPDRLAKRLAQLHGADSSACAGHTMVRVRLGELRQSDGRVTTKAWKKLLFGAQLPGKAERMTRGLVAAKTGVSASTQRRYEHEGGTYHSDGTGHAPVESPILLVDWTKLSPVLTTARLQILFHPQSPLADKGLFLFRDKAVGQNASTLRLVRQAPKTYQSCLHKVRRHLNRSGRKNSPHTTCYGQRNAGNVGNHSPLLSYDDAEPKGKKKPRVWIAPTSNPRMREALPMASGLGLLEIFGGQD